MLYEWTKRLGQKHYAQSGKNETLCGRPMLGNNYSELIQESDKELCEDCTKGVLEITFESLQQSIEKLELIDEAELLTMFEELQGTVQEVIDDYSY